MRRIVMVALAALAGAIIIVDGFAPQLGLGPLRQILVDGAVILGTFALLAGVINLIGWHARRVSAQEGSPLLSILLVLALLGTATAAIAAPDTATPVWIYAHLYAPVQASLMALLAFYAVSAAYRTFALRTPDAVLLMVSAALILLLQLPFVEAISPQLGEIRAWLLQGPLAGIVRGVLLGAALGAMTASLRVLLGLDRPQIGE
jgi:hypothetical protein